MVKKTLIKDSLQDIIHAEEILREDLEKLRAEEDLAKEQLHQLRLKGLSRNKVCCDDVCDTVSSMVKNIGKKIDEFESIHEQHLTTSLDKSASRQLNVLKERKDELEDLIKQLKERSICDCIVSSS